jgi:hypothetical protein
MSEETRQEIATLIAAPRAIHERLAQNLREAEVLKRLLKAAEYAAKKMSEQEASV